MAYTVYSNGDVTFDGKCVAKIISGAHGRRYLHTYESTKRPVLENGLYGVSEASKNPTTGVDVTRIWNNANALDRAIAEFLAGAA